MHYGNFFECGLAVRPQTVITASRSPLCLLQPILLGDLAGYSGTSSLQRLNTESLKKIFPDKELRGLSPNFQIHVSVSDGDLYISTIDLPILLQENMCRPQTHECGNWD
jgi:hypothetical protein